MREVFLYMQDYKTYSIIEYCLRPLSEEKKNIVQGSVSSILTFEELKEKNIRAIDLFHWSSPIDLVERYEEYFQKENSSSNDRFWNCSNGWFGSFCQYTFQLNLSFSDIGWKVFRGNFLSDESASCYILLKCNGISSSSSPLCLDWREICDGKVNCFNDEEDEKNCEEIQLNECERNEYQCRNGMCIDQRFLFDSSLSLSGLECLDGTDEVLEPYLHKCNWPLEFGCEERVCSSPFSFSCGDGRCLTWPIQIEERKCANTRDRAFDLSVDSDEQTIKPFVRCWNAIQCLVGSNKLNLIPLRCEKLCENSEKCRREMIEHCQSLFDSSSLSPINTKEGEKDHHENESLSICFYSDQCPFLTSLPHWKNNQTCFSTARLDFQSLKSLFLPFLSCSHRLRNTLECPKNSSMFRCSQSNKCLPWHRILNGIANCPGVLDESPLVNSCQLNDTSNVQCLTEKRICLPPVLLYDEVKQCPQREDEMQELTRVTDIRDLFFSAICDGWIDLVFMGNESDETHCEHWSCVNQYTICNGLWNCPKGIDELNCPSSWWCPVDHHQCLLAENHRKSCLHLDRIDDGIVDCLGATDERKFCQEISSSGLSKRYRCWNTSKCIHPDNRCGACGKNFDKGGQSCEIETIAYEEASVHFKSLDQIYFLGSIPFSPRSSRPFPRNQSTSTIEEDQENEETEEEEEEKSFQSLSWDETNVRRSCGRGIFLYVSKEKRKRCLCPSSYYGDDCEYQNERVTLTLRFRQEEFVQVNAAIVLIKLVDDREMIHSHQQLIYIPSRHCRAKFNLRLLYRDRPKDRARNYTVQIEIYQRKTLVHLVSWILPVKFLFMPVNRVSGDLIIPKEETCHLLCNPWKRHGSNSCRCRLETMFPISSPCNCAPGSICRGLVNNRSICLCPLNKVGPRCFLDSVCQMNSCLNGGLCIPKIHFNSFKEFLCLCPEEYSGIHCQKKKTEIDISFSDIETPLNVLLHLITAREHQSHVTDPMPIRATMFQKIRLYQKTVPFFISLPFHLIFAQIEEKYYLVLLQHHYTSGALISTTISSNLRCPFISEIFSKEIVDQLILRRVKSYHLPCLERSDLPCFHDNETFICLCTEDRRANCFHFDFNVNYDCHGLNDCLNGGKCFQDHRYCPTKSMCVCEECFYGSKCQFTTNTFGLSLDTILGYHIQTHRSLHEQPVLVQVSITLATCMFFVGLINGTLCLLTFQSKVSREVGCGLYLYASSITSIFLIVLLNLKLYFLILSQTLLVTSQSFLLFSCHSMDFLIRSFLSNIDWFNACVAVERIFVLVLDIHFNKRKSKRLARWMILAVSLFTVLSTLHDPIYRRLIEDREEKRTWCILRFPKSIETYNSSMHLFHFVVPLSFNVLSAISIIILSARKRSSVNKQQTYKQHLKEQFHQHKHLIFSSIILVILSLPRLVISFTSGCMKIAKDAELYLAGYFISFVPSLLTLIIFVLPSKIYRKQLNYAIEKQRNRFACHFSSR